MIESFREKVQACYHRVSGIENTLLSVGFEQKGPLWQKIVSYLLPGSLHDWVTPKASDSLFSKQPLSVEEKQEIIVSLINRKRNIKV